jgi:hypothetical protein
MARTRNLGAALVASILASGFWVAPALGSGGHDITSGPGITFGTQLFGNTATDGDGRYLDQCIDDTPAESWWNLSTVAGDRVTIDWEGSVGYLKIWGPGTTDFNVADTEGSVDSISENGKQETVFTLTVSGVHPLEFYNCDGYQQPAAGPYDFVVYVQHALSLFVPKGSIQRKGTLAVQAHTAEGGVVNDSGIIVDVEVKTKGVWKNVGSATGVTDSVAAVPLHIAKRLAGTKPLFRAVASGGAFRQATSTAQKLRVQ